MASHGWQFLNVLKVLWQCDRRKKFGAVELLQVDQNSHWGDTSNVEQPAKWYENPSGNLHKLRSRPANVHENVGHACDNDEVRAFAVMKKLANNHHI